MGKYLIKASYNAEGVKGLLKEGGVARKTQINQLVSGLGGRMESFYFAFGMDDAYVIADIPEITGPIALSLAINSAGLAKVNITVLLEPEEIDKATKTSVLYRGPGK
jgi:uncharacterized protein with GYD domain